MKLICLFSPHTCRSLGLLLAGWAIVLGSGCAMSSIAPIAPRSAVPRESAMSMAQFTASAVGGKVFTVAATGSMKPTLDENSIVTVETVTFTALRQGDIVIYRSAAGAPIIHRLYEQHGDRWLVLGDNNPAIDREAVTAGNFLGRVCAIFYTSSGAASSSPTAFAQR
jgi:signal peptidase I